MDGNLTEMLQGVLNDPEAIKKLKSTAEALMGGNDQYGGNAEKHNEAYDTGQSVNNGKAVHSNDEYIALISALRPYLSPERHQTAETLIRLLKVIKLSDIGRLLKE